MKQILLFSCLFFSLNCLSQEHGTIRVAQQKKEINQLDAYGKRTGKWLIHLDADWKRTDDTTKAKYRRYTFYDQGINLYPMGPCGKKGYRLEGIRTTYLLHGTYRWFDEEGNLSSEHVFEMGEYISCKEYYRSGELQQHFDYTKKCEGFEHGWIVTLYDKTGRSTVSYPNCPDANGKWPKTRD